MFSLHGLVSAISRGLAAAGVPKLGAIGFDACLMAMFEVRLPLYQKHHRGTVENFRQRR
jgi:hypothetical protein